MTDQTQDAANPRRPPAIATIQQEGAPFAELGGGIDALSLFNLSGKVALVTGASRGLGQSFSRALASAGADLIITSRTLDSLYEFQGEVEDLGRECLPLELDVTRVEDIKPVIRRAIEHYGKIDILVNNAGCNIRKPALSVTPEDWDTILDTNLKGAFFVMQAVAEHMLENQYGRIINIGSVTTMFGYGGLAPYSASRGGIGQMTKSFATEVGKLCGDITVNCLAPGWFKTNQNAEMYDDSEWLNALIERIPLNRPGAPQDLMGPIVFLASDASAYITGQTLFVDGGITTGAMSALPKKRE